MNEEARKAAEAWLAEWYLEGSVTTTASGTVRLTDSLAALLDTYARERAACGHLAADRSDSKTFPCAGCMREIVASGPDLSSLGPDFAALPPSVRKYIAGIETNCDPSGMVRENVLARDEIRALRVKVIEQRDRAAALVAAYKQALKPIQFYLAAIPCDSPKYDRAVDAMDELAAALRGMGEES